MVEHEENYQPRLITISQACGLVWKCNDILPGTEFRCFENLPEHQRPKRQTYSACAQAMLAVIKQSQTATKE
jgi:hypothetical protein